MAAAYVGPEANGSAVVVAYGQQSITVVSEVYGPPFGMEAGGCMDPFPAAWFWVVRFEEKVPATMRQMAVFNASVYMRRKSSTCKPIL